MVKNTVNGDMMMINEKRLLSELKKLREITDTPGDGVTRFSYSQKDKEVREYLVSEAANAGFSVHTDAVGNMYIGLGDDNQDISLQTSDPEHNEKKKILVGSHIDTVKNGGWLDGIYGVIGAFEALRILKEGEHKLACEVGLIIFAEEEGSNFGSCMTGSKFVTGIYGERDLDGLQNDDGVSMRKMLKEAGCPDYKKDRVVWDFDRVGAMLELHIEQGPVLDEKDISIGVVDWVNGMAVAEVTLTGVGNHAGATPMGYRRDTLVAAALCVARIEEIAKQDAYGITVATVGKLNVSPNCSNVIPEKVVFTVEVRDKDADKINKTMDKMADAIKNIASERKVGCEIRETVYSLPIKMNEKIKNVISECASKAGFSNIIMNSGAVHDACMVAAHAPAGMIFVPSKGGRSHVPFEDTDEEDLIKGARLLLDTILAL